VTRIYRSDFQFQYESLGPARAAEIHLTISLALAELNKKNPHMRLVKHEQIFVSDWTPDNDTDTENSHHHEARSLDDQYINNQ